MKVTPVDIQQIGFRKAFRGYDRREVDAFLASMTETFEDMTREHRAAKEHIAALEAALQELKQKEELLNQTLVSAERMVEDMKRQAQREADLRLREAEVSAESLTRKAREERVRIEQEVVTWRRRQVELVEQFRGFLKGIEKSLDLALEPADPGGETTPAPGEKHPAPFALRGRVREGGALT